MSDLHPSITDDSSYTRTRITSDAYDAWPKEPTVTTHVIEGALADRVRRRMNAGGEVRLTETTIYGGYEYTRETNTEFTVGCGSEKVTFYPEGGEVDWRDEAGKSWADSVFARFDAWLAVAERPLELLYEWFEFAEEAGAIVEFRAKEGTILRRAAHQHNYFTDAVILRGTTDMLGRHWEVDLVGEDGRIRARLDLGGIGGSAVTPDAARSILFALTDRLMPGREH